MDDVYDVLKQNRDSETSSKLFSAAAAPSSSPARSAISSLWRRWAGRLGRDRVLLMTLLFVIYSVILLGVGIAIGKGNFSGSASASAVSSAEGGSRPAPASYVTVRALVLTGENMVRAQKAAADAKKNLKVKFPDHPVFDIVQGKNLCVCVGRFPAEPGRHQEEIRKLKDAIKLLTFKTGQETRSFDPVDIKVQP